MDQSINCSESLCLQCGLCCNGVIFADVRSPNGISLGALKSLGARPKPLAGCGGPKMFSIGQPCVAFRGMRCQVYSERPGHCRKFDCLLLKGVKTNKRSLIAAREIVERARTLAERVRKLMVHLGNAEEHLPMAKRFQRVRDAMEVSGNDAAKNKTYADLTLRYHELTHLLSAEFYQE